MKKGFGVLVFAVVFCLLSVGLVSARLMISEPDEIYSLGDKLYVNVDGIRGSESGNLNINLKCANANVNLLKISARAFSPEGRQSYSLPYKILTKKDLEIESLNGIVGNCHISASIGNEQASTQIFQISDEIFIDASTDKLNYDPGEAITLSLDATRANGNLVDGFVEGSNAGNFSKEIEVGVFSEVFSMPEDSAAGDYVLDVFVYDVGEDEEILNQGEGEVLFKINQIATSIEMSLSSLEITPEESLTVSADLYDQSGKKMEGGVSILLVSPNGEEIQKTAEVGEFIPFNFPLNAAAGEWKVLSSFVEVSEESKFEMLEFQKVEFEFEGSILIVKNVGNARYNKTVGVDIGDATQAIDLNVGVGGEKRFNLRAPDGEYDVVVDDDESSASASVALTGKAISIKDLESVGIFKGYSIVWVFLIIILAGVGVVLFFKYKKKTIKLGDKMKTIGQVPKKVAEVKDKIKDKIKKKIKNRIPEEYSSKVSNTLQFTNKSPESQSLEDYDKEEHNMIDLTQSKVGIAESSLVLKGERNPSAVISLYIKNYDALGNDGQKRLATIVAGVKKNKGLVDWRGEHIFIIFSPLVTKTFKNELLASKSGFDILQDLNSQNKKFKDKIEFNIGINSGDLVASKEDGKLKYTSIGNTIALAKKIADSDSGKLLISDFMRKSLMHDLRTEKAGEIAKTTVWEVSKMIDRGANEEKLQEILRRMKQEEKSAKKKK